MAWSQRKSNIWHPSRGFVFAGDTRVVYPRLPTTRFYSAPAVVSGSENESRVTSGSGSLGENLVAADNAVETQHVTTAVPVSGAEPTPDDRTKPSEASIEAHESAAVGEAKEDPADMEPPFTPLEYKIPPDVFRAAKLASEDSPESYWSYNLYRGPDENGDLNTKIKVHYCTSQYTTERVLQQYFMDEKLLGFDLEWEPDASSAQGAKKNVSLVQLASKSRIGLFHVALFNEKSGLVAPSLKKIMEDPGVTKVGVAIKGDCTRLRKYLLIDSRGVFELSNLYKLVKFSTSKEYQFINRKLVSLASQVQEYLRLPLFKGSMVRSSAWSRALKMDQIVYSASDAYAAVQLYATLDHLRQNLDPTPPLPHFVEEGKPIRLADGVVLPTAEEAPPQETDTGANQTVSPSEKYLDSLKDTIMIEGDDSSEPLLLPGQSSTKETTTKSLPSPQQPKDKRVTDAEALAAEYRSNKPILANVKQNSYAAAYQLRAYYMWHNNTDLGPKEIAALLRNPPLQTTTVVNYILETIRLEKLPYDGARLKSELLSCVPKEALSSWRYYHFVGKNLLRT
ncbi:putative Werner syndrome helicase [Rhypophila decipiens]